MEKMLLNSKVPFLQRTKYQLVWFKFSLTPLTSVCWASTPLQQLLLCYTLCCWPKTDAGQVDGLILSGRKCKWLPGGGHQWGTQAKTWILQYSKGEKVEVLTSFLFLGSKITADGDCSHEVRRRLLLGRKAMTNLDSVLKNRRYSADKGPYSQGYGVLSSHVWLWELDHKEGRTPKNWCLQTVVLEKIPESPLDSKESKPVNLKRNQPQILVGRTDAEGPVSLSSDANSWLIGKVADAAKDWGQKEKRASEDEMVGQHHWRNEHELGQTLGDGKGQGGLVCCSPWGHKESDTTGWLNNNKGFWNHKLLCF